MDATQPLGEEGHPMGPAPVPYLGRLTQVILVMKHMFFEGKMLVILVVGGFSEQQRIFCLKLCIFKVSYTLLFDPLPFSML